MKQKVDVIIFVSFEKFWSAVFEVHEFYCNYQDSRIGVPEQILDQDQIAKQQFDQSLQCLFAIGPLI